MDLDSGSNGSSGPSGSNDSGGLMYDGGRRRPGAAARAGGGCGEPEDRAAGQPGLDRAAAALLGGCQPHGWPRVLAAAVRNLLLRTLICMCMPAIDRSLE